MSDDSSSSLVTISIALVVSPLALNITSASDVYVVPNVCKTKPLNNIRRSYFDMSLSSIFLKIS